MVTTRLLVLLLLPPQAFRLSGGLNKLLALLGCHTDTAVTQPEQQQDTPEQQQQEQGEADPHQQQQQQRRLQRKVLALLQYVFAKHPADGAAAAEYGLVPHLQVIFSNTLAMGKGVFSIFYWTICQELACNCGVGVRGWTWLCY